MTTAPHAPVRYLTVAESASRRDSAVAQPLVSERAYSRRPDVPRETLAYVAPDAGSKLLAILATPPLVTSGERTLARVRMAAEFIGSTSVIVGNLLEVATKDVREIATVGRAPECWRDSRESLEAGIAAADSVLFAWGCAEPTGPARHHHRAQVAWIMDVLQMRVLPYWTFGGRPRHPSRWQRYTSREHPGSPFSTALAASLQLEQAGRDPSFDLAMRC